MRHDKSARSGSHPDPGAVPRTLAVIPTKGTVCLRGGIPYYNSPEIIFPGCLLS